MFEMGMCNIRPLTSWASRLKSALNESTLGLCPYKTHFHSGEDREMAERVEQMLAVPIQLGDEVSKTAAEAESFKQECLDLKKQTDKLSALLRQAARVSGGLYERPTGRITEETNKVLNKALALVTKCSRRNGMIKRVFTITSAAAFRKMGVLLDSCIGDVTWLLNVSASGDEREEHLGLPPIATNDPMLGHIWEQIARLHTATPDEKADSAASLVSLAQDSDRNAKLIAEEGGIPPLLKLLKDGSATLEAQKAAAKALGKLGNDRERVRQMIHDGVASAFAKVLKDGVIEVQSAVAWALSQLLSTDPDSQDHFAQSGIIRSLVGHLAFETVQENSKYMVGLGPQAMTIHSVVTAAKVAERTHYIHIPNNTGTGTRLGMPSLSGLNLKGRELEDPSVKAGLKAEVAKALWKLAKDNIKTCKTITESKALVCFAILLEKGQGDVLYNSAMAVMEIAAVAEQNADLRRSAFKTNSPAAKALVGQLLRIIEGQFGAQEDSQVQLLKACVKAIGCLARTFPARETRLIDPLVKHLDHRDLSVSTEAAVALSKFACKENYLHMEHSKAIIDASGAPQLIQLAYFGEGVAHIPALILLCYLALHVDVGDSEALVKAEVLSALEWASKQVALIQDPTLDALLPEAKSRLELYQSRGLGLGFRYS